MGTIISRKLEKKELERLYRLKRPEFLVVYGRRRVGKTFLIREYFKDKFAFYHTGLSPYEGSDDGNALGRQLLNFHSSMLKYGCSEILPPANWIEAFDRLAALLEKKGSGQRMVVFIDELPWMDTQKSGFLPAFEHFWNGWGAGRDDLLLIVCGSATAWITDKLLNNTGGLYGRMTAQMKLRPLTLSECAEYYEAAGLELSIYDQLQYNMIMGGIPYYMNMIRSGESLAMNIDRIFFNRESRLRDEFDRLFNSLFKNAENYVKTVRLLAGNRSGYSREEISEKCGIPYGGGLTTILKALEANDFIVRYRSFGAPAKDIRYRLTDPFLLFYLHFADSGKTLSDGYWTQFENTPRLYAWRGLAFENVCFNHIAEIKKLLGISGVYSETSAWTRKGSDGKRGAQIDMLMDRADRVINLCEMKFSESPYTIDKDEELRLRSRKQAFYDETGTKKAVHLTLITTFGLVENRWSSIFQNVITAENLIGASE